MTEVVLFWYSLPNSLKIVWAVIGQIALTVLMSELWNFTANSRLVKPMDLVTLKSSNLDILFSIIQRSKVSSTRAYE